jgi:hypothetical protein
MRILKKIAIRFLVAAINQMPVSALNFFEGRVQQKLGKGGVPIRFLQKPK